MKIEVFGIDTCGKCSELKKKLDNMGVEYSYKTVGVDIDRNDLNVMFGRVISGVPVILFNGGEVNATNLMTKLAES